MTDIKKLIEELLCYASINLDLEYEDIPFFRNLLMHELNVLEKYDGDEQLSEEINSKKGPSYFVKNLTEYYVNELHLDNETAEKRITYIFGMLTPLPSKVQTTFEFLLGYEPRQATNYFHNMCIANNYVAVDKISKNVMLDTGDDHYNLIAEINVAKPEKSNADIAKELAKPKGNSNYPACAICLDNVGCFGSSKTPPRNNLRTIEFTLNNNTWYMQYSPYEYFNEHSIVFCKDHTPMCVNKDNISALFDFVYNVPHYFIGANSDLPIVGGSILTHEHFQGGSYDMPMFKAGIKEEIKLSLVDDVKAYVLNYPGTVFRFVSKNKDSLISLADSIINLWKEYDDEALKIVSKDHNTMTTVVRRDNDEYQLYICLRNNLTTEEYPDGMFHTQKALHHIKKEGIGLIEISGVFVLPARLDRQLKLVEEIVNDPSKKSANLEKWPDLQAFLPMIDEMSNHKYKDMKDYLGATCEQMLKDIDVFKYDDVKHTGLYRFFDKLNETRK